MNVTYQMSFKYGTATKATRDIPLIKYAKKLGNQVLHAVKYLREDKFYWNYKDYTLEFPVESADDDADNRPFIREVRFQVCLSFSSILSTEQLDFNHSNQGVQEWK